MGRFRLKRGVPRRVGAECSARRGGPRARTSTSARCPRRSPASRIPWWALGARVRGHRRSPSSTCTSAAAPTRSTFGELPLVARACCSAAPARSCSAGSPGAGSRAAASTAACRASASSSTSPSWPSRPAIAARSSTPSRATVPRSGPIVWAAAAALAVLRRGRRLRRCSSAPRCGSPASSIQPRALAGMVAMSTGVAAVNASTWASRCRPCWWPTPPRRDPAAGLGRRRRCWSRIARTPPAQPPGSRAWTFLYAASRALRTGASDATDRPCGDAGDGARERSAPSSPVWTFASRTLPGGGVSVDAARLNVQHRRTAPFRLPAVARRSLGFASGRAPRARRRDSTRHGRKSSTGSSGAAPPATPASAASCSRRSPGGRGSVGVVPDGRPGRRRRRPRRVDELRLFETLAHHTGAAPQPGQPRPPR